MLQIIEGVYFGKCVIAQQKPLLAKIIVNIDCYSKGMLFGL